MKKTKATQFRRGTSDQHLTFAGLGGEVTVDTDTKIVRVHNGASVGGFPLAREDLTNVTPDSVAEIGISKDDLSNLTNASEAVKYKRKD